MSTQFKKGDKVWFISKYGDRVTGTYEGRSTIPGVGGTIAGHNVRSNNAFGHDSDMSVLCFVPAGADALHHE